MTDKIIKVISNDTIKNVSLLKEGEVLFSLESNTKKIDLVLPYMKKGVYVMNVVSKTTENIVFEAE